MVNTYMQIYNVKETGEGWEAEVMGNLPPVKSMVDYEGCSVTRGIPTFTARLFGKGSLPEDIYALVDNILNQKPVDCGFSLSAHCDVKLIRRAFPITKWERYNSMLNSYYPVYDSGIDDPSDDYEGD